MAEQQTILVVDDDRFNVTLMRELCQSAGYRVLEAHDGFEALRLARQEMPDLMLLDLMMSGKNGFEVCQEIRGDPATSGMPVIIVTAMDDLDSKMRGIELGADDYVTKPFRLFELQQRIRSVLEARFYRRQLEQAQRKLQKLGDVDSPGRIGGFRQLRNGLEYEFKRAQRYQHPLAAVLFQVLPYESVLEQQGKKQAASIIGAVVMVLRESLRAVDRIYRIDQDQFLLLLPETDREGARRAIERVRQSLAEPPRARTGRVDIAACLVSYPDNAIRVASDMLHLLSEKCSAARSEDWLVQID